MNERNDAYKRGLFADYTSSYVYDIQHKKRIFNKSIFLLFLKISISVSAFMSIIYLISGDLIGLIIFAVVGFFGTFAVLTLIFFIERLYNKILNKIKKKKLKEIT